MPRPRVTLIDPPSPFSGTVEQFRVYLAQVMALDDADPGKEILLRGAREMLAKKEAKAAQGYSTTTSRQCCRFTEEGLSR